MIEVFIITFLALCIAAFGAGVSISIILGKLKPPNLTPKLKQLKEEKKKLSVTDAIVMIEYTQNKDQLESVYKEIQKRGVE